MRKVYQWSVTPRGQVLVIIRQGFQSRNAKKLLQIEGESYLRETYLGRNEEYIRDNRYPHKKERLLFSSLKKNHIWQYKQRLRHGLAASIIYVDVFHRRRQWHPTPVFLPGESQRQRSLVEGHLWGRTESDTTEVTQQQQMYFT